MESIYHVELSGQPSGLCSQHLPTTYKDNAASVHKSFSSLNSRYFSTSHTFIFIFIPFHSATTRDLESSTKDGYAGKRKSDRAQQISSVGEGIIRMGHHKLLPSHMHHQDVRVIHKFLKTHQAGKRRKKKSVNWAGRMVLTQTVQKS